MIRILALALLLSFPAHALVKTTASGSANAITLTPTDSTEIQAFANQREFLFKAVNTNTGATTLTTGSNIADLVKEGPSGQAALSGGEIVTGKWYRALYDSASGDVVISAYTTMASASGLGTAAYANVDDVPRIYPYGPGASGHNLAFLDQNWDASWDRLSSTSNNPTTFPAFIALGGTATNGNIVKLRLNYDSTNHDYSYTVQSGDDLTDVANAIISAINNDSVAAAAGMKAELQYFTANPTILVTPSSLHMPTASNASSGGVTTTMTIAQSNGLLEGNPNIQLTRLVPGRTPLQGDMLGNLIFIGQDSTSLLATIQYGLIKASIVNPTPGSHQGILSFETPIGTMNLSRGLYLADQRNGVAPSGGDMGPGTINVGGGYYVNGVPVSGASGTNGTCTPTISTSGGSFTPTYAIQACRWVKVGKLVYLHFEISVSSVSGSPTGNVIFNGLPHTTAAVSGQRGITCRYLSGVNPYGTGHNFFLVLANNGTTGVFQHDGPSIGASDMNAASLSGAFRYVCNGPYESAN